LPERWTSGIKTLQRRLKQPLQINNLNLAIGQAQNALAFQFRRDRVGGLPARVYAEYLSGVRNIKMKTLVDHLAQYAAYHRDQRNILSHFIGIPLIVLAVAVLLSRPGVEVVGLWLCPATLVALVAGLFYLRVDMRFGLLMALLLGLSLWGAASLAMQSTALWLSSGIGLFVVGWVIQFVGHYWEGLKPAFVDDVMGLAIGPLFVAAEAAFMLGLRKEVEQAIIERAGETCIREKKPSA
jgi:uncharacterized membrane protein YGL010W